MTRRRNDPEPLGQLVLPFDQFPVQVIARVVGAEVGVLHRRFVHRKIEFRLLENDRRSAGEKPQTAGVIAVKM